MDGTTVFFIVVVVAVVAAVIWAKKHKDKVAQLEQEAKDKLHIK